MLGSSTTMTSESSYRFGRFELDVLETNSPELEILYREGDDAALGAVFCRLPGLGTAQRRAVARDAVQLLHGRLQHEARSSV